MEALHQLTMLSRLPTRQKRLVAFAEYMTAPGGMGTAARRAAQHDPRLKRANEKQQQADEVIGQGALREREKGPSRSADYAISSCPGRTGRETAECVCQTSRRDRTTRATPRSR